MALFFRGKTRKFFLILLDGRLSEKNRAGFGRELREFSRRVADGFWRRIGVREAAASKTRGDAGGGPRARRWVLAGRAARVRAAERACPHPSDAQRSDWSRMRDVHNAGDRGEAGGHAHRSIAQGFESRRRPDVHTSIAPRFERMPTLTVDIHSATSRCRREISTPPNSRPAAATLALTCRMHRFASRFGGAISTPLSARVLLGSGGPAVTAMQACARRARVGCRLLRGWASLREHWRGFGVHRNMPSRSCTRCRPACGYRRHQTLKTL